MRLPLGESGVWESRIPPAVKARCRRVGTTRIRASKHGSCWKVPATSLQLSCLGPTHATDRACRGPRWWSKAANLSSTLIISCASSAQRNFPLSSRKTCGEDLACVGGRPWMRLGASSLLLPSRRLRSDGRWSLGQEQQAPSAASLVTEQPYLGSVLLTSTRGGA